MSTRVLDPVERLIALAKWRAGQPMTIDEIAVVMGVSRGRIWQVEQSAKAKIRSALEERLTTEDAA